MSKTLKQNGKSIDVTLTAAATSGVPIVVGAMVVIPAVDGAIGDTIACAVGEVHSLPKVDAAVIAAGETVDFDVSEGKVDDNAMTAATGDVTDFGIAWETKGATTDETIDVLLVPGQGTLTP